MSTSPNTKAYADLNPFDAKEYLPALRAWLRDIPTPRGYSESNRVLAEAFSWGNPAAYIPTNEFLFYGESDLRELFGRRYEDALYGRILNPNKQFALDQKFFPEHPDLRGLVDKYVVAGFTTRQEPNGNAYKTVAYPKKLLFRSGVIENADYAEQPVRTHERAGELVHVRGGLMNRRQATLLANHLNSYHRNARFNEVLSWKVVRGPAQSESARLWLNAHGGKNLFLRKHEGSPTTRSIESAAKETIAVYGCEQATPRHREQVFAYQRPRHSLPPRYTLSFVHGSRPRGVPEDEPFNVWREHPCEVAEAMADAYEKAGFIEDWESKTQYMSHSPSLDAETQAALLFDYDEDADGAPQQYSYGTPASSSYARALDRNEAIRVVRELRRLGHRRIQLATLGINGRYERMGRGTSNYLASLGQVEKSLGDMAPSLGGYVAEAEPFMPWEPVEEWPEWASERWA